MTMEHERAKHQVQYLGLSENVRVKKAGYSYRARYDEFTRRFGILASRCVGLARAPRRPV